MYEWDLIGMRKLHIPGCRTHILKANILVMKTTICVYCFLVESADREYLMNEVPLCRASLGCYKLLNEVITLLTRALSKKLINVRRLSWLLFIFFFLKPRTPKFESARNQESKLHYPNLILYYSNGRLKAPKAINVCHLGSSIIIVRTF